MKFYTVEEVAKMLKVKPKTVRLWLQKGKLQGIKIGRFGVYLNNN